ncbi:hypothetical protein EMCG_05406 [[Emmonsia] crescens]|uniref:HNH nuclease domain-containing protein n=1 Tax=[Emmonsia] crescens TaxID=73230 RepID=A0A0G2IXL9_9EURO|nr:hypothetical protein EMCG_05406 [Emmonsia crescens UAMH 3008]
MEPAISGGPDAEFHDPERVRLIGKILRALRELEISQGADPGSWPPLSELAWSCLWLSDMKSLANITTRFEENPSELHLNLRSRFAAAGFEALWTGKRSAPTPKSGPSTPTYPKVETQPLETAPSPAYKTPDRKRKRIDSSSPSSDPATPRSARSKRLVELCRKRDRACVLTKATEPTNASHIIPFSLGSRALYQSAIFWETLSIFWEESKISQPLSMSNDKKSLTIKFFWLCPNNLDSLRLSTSALPEDPSQEFTVEPPSLPASLGQGGRKAAYGEHPNIRLYNCETDERISSGQIITLTTEDPEAMPLPDLKLLDLQWTLHRVFALAAAAGYNGDDENYDDDDMRGREPVIVSEEEDLLDEYEEPWAEKSFETHTFANAMGLI